MKTQPAISRDEALIIAREAVALAEGCVGPEIALADARLRARAALDDAQRALARDAARPALMWACKAVQHARGILSASYAEVQAKYDVVYNSHMAEG